MAKAKKIARLQGQVPPGARGRTARTTAQVESNSDKGALARSWRTDTNRPITSGGRGDRRDTSPTYTTNVKHAARGNTPRRDVKTRKR